MKLYFILILITYNMALLAEESGVIYQNDKLNISYDRNQDSFIFSDKKLREDKKYSRFRYRDLILEQFSKIPLEDRDKLEERLKQIKQVYEVSNPSPEEVLYKSLVKMDSLNEEKYYGCEDSYMNITENENLFLTKISLPKNKGNRLIDLGKLEGVELEVNTNNDNPLHGLSMQLGLTSYDKDRDGFEGDDRGLTYGMNFSAKVKYENGHLFVKYGSKAYTKMVGVPCGTKDINGHLHYQTCYRNEDDGTWNQEGLNRDDLDIKVLKKVGSDKSAFIEFGGGLTIFDDKGFALATQREFHSLTKDFDNIQYRNQEHMERIVSPKLNFKVGKIISLGDVDDRVRSQIDYYAGAQTSYIGENENYIMAGGSLKVDIMSSNKDKRFPVLETKFYLDSQYTQKGEVNKYYGIEARGNFYQSEKSVVYIKIGMGHEDDYLSREYELYGGSPTNNDLDLQHYIGIGFEKKF